MSAPTESKVWGATVGTGAGYIISQFVLWFLGITVWGVSADALSAGEAVTAVPDPVNGLIGLGVTTVGGFIGGWLAKHTPRPEDYTARRALPEDNSQGEVVPAPEAEAVGQSPYPVPEYPESSIQPI